MLEAGQRDLVRALLEALNEQRSINLRIGSLAAGCAEPDPNVRLATLDALMKEVLAADERLGSTLAVLAAWAELV